MKTTYEIIEVIKREMDEYLRKEYERYKLLGYSEDDLVLDCLPYSSETYSKHSPTLHSDDIMRSAHFEVYLRPKTDNEK